MGTEDETSHAQAGVEAPRRSELIYCQVCLEHVRVTSTTALSECGHRFCSDCLWGFLTIQISDGRIDFNCFHVGDDTTSCQAAISAQDIEKLVAPPTLTKYRRFVTLRNHENARECPFCNHVQLTSATPQEPSCVCDQCSRVFCLNHSDAHAENESCEQFERRRARREKRSGRRIRHISRPCPQCGRPIEKNGGCSHMTCYVCKFEFCWWCGKKWGFALKRHSNPLDAECCKEIAQQLVPGLASKTACIRWPMQIVYYLVMVGVAAPVTLIILILKSWAWIPALMRGGYSIRYEVLVRYLAIKITQATIQSASLFFTCVYAVLSVLAYFAIGVCEVLEWIAQRFRLLGRRFHHTISNCSCRFRLGRQVKPHELDSPPFVILGDLERGQR